jgi:ketosteroid isomerase-like protein
MTKTLVCFLIAVAAVSAADPDRAADRAAIRAHIERIFDAFIHKDAAELRATHAPNWLGYLEGSRTAIHGADGYMDHSGHFTPGYGMTGYKIREFDMIFQGDAAFVAFVAEVEANTPDGPHQRTLRITDFYTKQNGAWIQTGSDTDLHPESVEKREEQPQKLPEWERKELLEAREKVWRAFFSGDRATLEKLLPAELVTLEPHPDPWGTRESTLESSANFHAAGGKLISIEFPKTEIQLYGQTAIVYSEYKYGIEMNGERSVTSGKATEVFVYRDGGWVNPSWHLDQQK